MNQLTTNLEILNQNIVQDQHQPKEIFQISNINSFDQNENDICKICFASESLQNLFVQPCRCSGSLQYTHQKCLIEWINLKIKANVLKQRSCKQNIYCQICSQKLQFQKCWVLKWKQKYQIIKNIHQSIILQLVITLISIISVLLFFAILQAFLTAGNNSKTLQFKQIKFIASTAFQLIILIGLFICRFCLKDQMVIKKIIQKNTNANKVQIKNKKIKQYVEKI